MSRIYEKQIPRGENYDRRRVDLSVETVPSGASIRIDGELRNDRTPAAIMLSKGGESYKIEIDRPGYAHEMFRVSRTFMSYPDAFLDSASSPDVGCLTATLFPFTSSKDEQRFVFEPSHVVIQLKPVGQGLEIFYDDVEGMGEAEVWIDGKDMGLTRGVEGVFYPLSHTTYTLKMRDLKGAEWETEFEVERDRHTVINLRRESKGIIRSTK